MIFLKDAKLSVFDLEKKDLIILNFEKAVREYAEFQFLAFPKIGNLAVVRQTDEKESFLIKEEEEIVLVEYDIPGYEVNSEEIQILLSNMVECRNRESLKTLTIDNETFYFQLKGFSRKDILEHSLKDLDIKFGEVTSLVSDLVKKSKIEESLECYLLEEDQEEIVVLWVEPTEKEIDHIYSNLVRSTRTIH